MSIFVKRDHSDNFRRYFRLFRLKKLNNFISSGKVTANGFQSFKIQTFVGQRIVWNLQIAINVFSVTNMWFSFIF